MNVSKNIRAHLFGDWRSGQFAKNIWTVGEVKLPLADNDSNVNLSQISTVVKSDGWGIGNKSIS